MNDQLQQICRDYKITDYLTSKGIEPFSTGKKVRYHCMLPDHPKDNTPSFYVTSSENGQLFKCFGCGAGGGIVSLIRIMEGHKSNGFVVRKLARVMGIKLDGGIEISAFEPSAEAVMTQFCMEDELSIYVANLAKQFIKTHGYSEDAVNKVALIYEQIDKMIEEGKNDQLITMLRTLKNAIEDYES